jgi:acyl-CoA dehydrogenase
MDFRLTSEQLELRKAARDFAEREFPNIARECDQEESFPLELLGKASRSGLVAIFVDKKYGGRGFGYLENAIVMEEFWRVDPGLGSQVMCACFGSEMILLKGSEEQKRKYLPPICNGEAISAVAVTEPDAGSDVLSVSRGRIGRARDI